MCPYCLKQTLYFDNDYIPMNYTFIKLASIYYGISSLGCSFREIKKILKKIDVLIDGLFIIERRDITLKLRGSSNQRVIDVKDSILEGKITLYG